LILLLAVVAGLVAGGIRSLTTGHRMAAPKLRYLWIVALAFIPQFFAFQLSATSVRFPDRWIPIALIGTQLLLLIFAAANIRQPGFWLLGLGLLLNLVVIIFNGGWMPISPETVARLAPDAPVGYWEIGERLAASKDKILALADTRLWFLSDRYVLPNWSPFRVAFSVGDLLIAGGAISFLWSLGGSEK
jgi:hypothetical protein